jgi:predicted SnoaL-like aldol condensation-catalyzing enzyme
MSNQNKDAAVSFLTAASNGQVDEAYSKFIGGGFKHHNPFFEGTAEALQAGMKANAKQNPDKILEVKRVIAEDDFVVIHSHVRQNPDALGAVVVHIFRFENGKIVELWDLGQPVPENSSNENGMF